MFLSSSLQGRGNENGWSKTVSCLGALAVWLTSGACLQKMQPAGRPPHPCQQVPKRPPAAHLELRSSSCWVCRSWEAGCMSATVTGLAPGCGALQVEGTSGGQTATHTVAA